MKLSSEVHASSLVSSVQAKGFGLHRVGEAVRAGNPVHIGFFGTSVTRALWPEFAMTALKSIYPAVAWSSHNASLGGTDSLLGVFRMEKDLLSKHSDLIVIEFVNDNTRSNAQAISVDIDAMMLKVRQRYPECDMVCVAVPIRDAVEDVLKGQEPRHIEAQRVAAERHGVPFIDINELMAARIAQDELTWEDYSRDNVHPDEVGHQWLADCFVDAFGALLDLPNGLKPVSAPLDAAAMTSRLLPVGPEHLSCHDSMRAIEHWSELVRNGDLIREYPERVDYYGKHVPTYMPEIRWLDTPGDAIEMEVETSMLGIYDIQGPATGWIEVFVDGVSVGTFDRYISAGQNIFRISNGIIVYESEHAARHHVRIQLLDQPSSSGGQPYFLPVFWMLRS